VLPLLLEDEPPPASLLAVRMATAPASAPEQSALPAQSDKPDAAITPATPPPRAASAAPQAEAAAKPEPQPESEPVKPAPAKAEPVKPPSKPASKPQPAKPAATPATQAKPAAAGTVYVVQLAALSDAAKASELKTHAAQVGLPAYTDSVGKLTRVRVGPYPSREAAVAAAVKLAENGMAGQVVAK
ncbi:MAG: SPOR domain-containing protein, partial [Thiobacillus sp.]